MINALGSAAAAAAYGNAARLPAAGGAASSFGDVLQKAVTEAIDTGRQADSAASAAITGQGGITEAVLAVSKAEVVLQTAVAMRDKVVSAYQEVMRMPI